jgi:hypothetical protein
MTSCYSVTMLSALAYQVRQLQQQVSEQAAIIDYLEQRLQVWDSRWHTVLGSISLVSPVVPVSPVSPVSPVLPVTPTSVLPVVPASPAYHVTPVSPTVQHTPHGCHCAVNHEYYTDEATSNWIHEHPIECQQSSPRDQQVSNQKEERG